MTPEREPAFAALIKPVFRTCLHEAGHSVVGIVLGVSDGAIWLTRNRGLCRPRTCPDEETVAVFAAAGAAAADRTADLDPLGFVGWSPRLLEQDQWPPDGTGLSDGELIAKQAGSPEAEQRIRQRAAELVEVHLDKILRVAVELYYAGAMTREDVIEVMQE